MGWSDWTRGAEIEPSIYAADFSRLGEEVGRLLEAGAKIFQIDVGDGHFVPAITIGPVVLRSISPLFRERGGIVDVHLMVESPERQFQAFADAGAHSVTLHYEASNDLAGLARAARELGLAVGLAVNPETPVEAAAEAAGDFDLVNCMGVHPGYSGQPFLADTTERVRRFRELLPAGVRIQVDGGVGLDNVRELREAGAELFVVGSDLFGTPDPVAAYRALALVSA